MFDGQSSQNSEILHDCPGASQRDTSFGIRGAFVEFSWIFHGVFVVLTLGRFSLEKKKIGAKLHLQVRRKASVLLDHSCVSLTAWKTQMLNFQRATLPLYHVHLRSLAAGGNQSSRRKRGSNLQGGQKLHLGVVAGLFDPHGIEFLAACLASLNWLALPLVLILHLSTLPPIHRCLPTCMIQSGSRIFCNGRWLIVACPGRKVNWRGSTFTWGCASTPLHRSIHWSFSVFGGLQCQCRSCFTRSLLLLGLSPAWRGRFCEKPLALLLNYRLLLALELDPRQAASQGLDFVALHGGVTMEDLAWSLLGVDLEDTPLPYLARTLPPREKGHNPKIYGQPWNIERPFTPPHRALPAGPSHFAATPPSHPPPGHVLPSLDRPLVAVNKSLASLPSSPPPLKSPPPVAPTGVHVGAKSKSSSDAIVSPSVAPSLPVAPAIKSHGSRFQTGVVAKGFTRIGWESPLMFWSSHLGDEIKSFIFHAVDVHAYSELREQWHLAFCKRSSMLQWLLHMEEHSFYLFLMSWQLEAFGQGAAWLYKIGRNPLLRRLSVQMTSKKNFNTILPFAMTIHNFPMWLLSWNIAKPSSVYACPWIRTLPSCLHPIGIHHQLTTNGPGPITGPWEAEGEHLFTHVWQSACIISTVVPCFVLLYTWPLSIDASYLVRACLNLSVYSFFTFSFLFT